VKSSQLIAPDRNDRRALRLVLSRLTASGVIPSVTPSLDAGIAKAGRALRAAILAEVPAYSHSGNPEVLPGFDTHLGEHLREIRRLFGGGEDGDFDFVRFQAHRRAEQRFPLDAILHAYRCGHQVLAHWLRDAAIATFSTSTDLIVSELADFAIEYTNTISTIMAAEYVSQTRTLAEAESDQRTELLNILFSGYDESDGRVQRLLKRAGYLEQRQAYCVAVAQSTNPAEMELPQRAQRIANAMLTLMAATPIRILVGFRNNVVAAVLSDQRRQSGWTTPQTNLAERLRPMLLELGTAVLVGTSTDHPSTSFLPKALHEATIALDFADVSRRVVQFSDLPIRGLMLHRGGDYVRSAAPRWIVAFMEADEKAKGSLVQTLRTLADCDLNVQQSGRQLGVHPNTIYSRLSRIKEISGLDGQRYHDLVELLLAADCWKT
jgi:sugar diacid utilization regulator